jgi:maleylpyruvate isomerase
MSPRTLYDYFRSSAAYRVRIALQWKGLAYEHVGVHLTRAGGEQHHDDYARLNPQKLVPAFIDQGETFTQSLAILEYLEEAYPAAPLLPVSPVDRAWVRSIAMTIACDIHPLNNLRVLQYLERTLGLAEDTRNAWYTHWIHTGFAALETRIKERAGRYCLGDAVSLADVCLIPQITNARRFAIPLTAYPTLLRIDAACRELDAFASAAPERQPDAP